MLILQVFGAVLGYPQDVPSFRNAELLRAIQNIPNPCKDVPSVGIFKVCTSDCLAYLTCNKGKVTSTTPTYCPNSTPYCYTNTTTSPSSSIPCFQSIESCIDKRDGTTYPSMCQGPTFKNDPSDCRKFSYCENDMVKYQYWCSRGTAFNYFTNNCQAITSNFVCQNVTADCGAASSPSE